MAVAESNKKKRTDIDQMIAAAGYKKPTLLQQLIMPPVLEGRDVDAESGIHPGKTLTIAIAALLALDRTKQGIKAIMLTKDRDQAQKLFKTLTQSLAAFNGGAVTAVIGFSDLIKKEARQLMEHSDFVVGTPSRLIDHIRRANVDLAAVEQVFIDEDVAFETEFESDICFILSKIKPSAQIVRFTHSRPEPYRTLEQLLKRPVFIREKDFARDHGVIAFSSITAENKAKILCRLFLALPIENAVIVIDPPALAHKIAADLRSVRLDGSVAHRETGRSQPEKPGAGISREGRDFVIVPKDMVTRVSLEGVTHIMNLELSLWETDFRKQLDLSQLDRAVIQCLTLVTPEEEPQLDAMQERTTVNMEKQQSPANEDVLKGTIVRLLEQARRSGNPGEMKRYLAAVKKSVPLGQRSLLIASLLKGMVHPLVARKVEMTTLFLGVGRLRDANPRDIAALFTQALSLAQDSLGDIRVFDNYSFVEIDKDVADKAIAALTDKDFKGRKLVINHSRKREEKRGFGGPRRYKRD